MSSFGLVFCSSIILTLYSLKTEGTCGEYDGVRSSECTEGFATLFHIDELEGNTDLDVRDSRQVLIPDINFTCSGTITRWIIGARWEGLSPAHTELQIWRRNSNTENTYTKVNAATLMIGSESSSEVYEYVLETPLAFKEGDILGYFQPQRSEISLYLEDSRRLTTYFTSDMDFNTPVSGDNFVLDVASVNIGTRYPVIAVTTDPPNCVCGFMSVERVYALVTSERRNNDRDTINDERLVLFPDIIFTCSGMVVKWIMGGERESFQGEFSELQIWRLTGGSVYQKITGTVISLLSDEDDNVYEYTVNPPLPFQTGDILGLFQPDETALQLHYDSDDDSSIYYVSEFGNSDVFDVNGENVDTRRGLPLVTVEIATLGNSVSSAKASSTESPFLTTISVRTFLPSPSAKESTSSGQIFISGIVVGGLVVLLTTVSIITLSVLVCVRKWEKNNTGAYECSGGQFVLRTTEANTEYSDIVSSYVVENPYSYAAYPTTAILFSNAAYNVQPSPHVGTSPTATTDSDIPTSMNVAYAVSCGDNHSLTTTKASKEAVYEAVTTNGAVESIHMTPNLAYGATAAHEAVTTNGAVESIHMSPNLAYGATACPMTDGK